MSFANLPVFEAAIPGLPVAACGDLERIVADTTNVALFFAVEELCLVYVNAAFRRITGLTADAGVGRAWMALLHEDDAQATCATYRVAYAGHARFTAEYRLRRHDGEFRWMRTYGVPHVDADGVFHGMVCCFLDITDLRLAREREAAMLERFTLAIAGSSEGIFDWPDLSQPTFWASARALELIGYSENEIESTRDTLLGLTHEADRERVDAALTASALHGRDMDIEFRLCRRDGHFNWFHVRAACVANATTGGRRLVGSLQDIDARVTALTKIQRLQDRFRSAIDASTSGLWDWELPERRVWFSPSVKNLVGYLPDADVRMDYATYAEHVHPDDRLRIDRAIVRHFKTREPFDIEYRLRHRIGGYRWYRSRGIAQWDDDGRATRMSGSVSDVHERKEAELALRAEREKALVTLTSIGDAVVTTDATGRIEMLNSAAEKLLRTRRKEAAGKPLNEVVRIVLQRTRQPIVDPVELCMQRGRVSSRGDSLLIAADGSEYAIEYTATPIRNDEGQVWGAVLVLRNVTQERRLQQEMSYQATHDGLTGLVNRVEFERRLTRVIRHAAATGGTHALCYLDLDQFKVINDTCGHGAGDELLRQIALVLRDTVRKRDTVARLGGDEFGILMEHCSLQQATRVASSVRERIADYRFRWERHVFGVGASIGLVIIDETSEQMADVMRHVDAACYLAKEQGRNRVHVYDPGDETMERRRGEIQWVSRINNALLESRFVLYVQPAIPLQNPHAPRYLEVLLRFRDGRVLRSPAEFLPAAERYSLSPKIDAWVLTALFDHYARDPALFRRDTLFAVNLSALSLCDESFLGFLDAALARSAFPADLLCFEITETAAIGNLSRAVQFFNAMRARGCRFALDDFGSGLSSFGYLRTLPVDFLKIDGLFVRDCVEDPIDFAMVKSINDIGHVMGIKTVAEFAENAAIEAKMRDLGIDYAQGYGISEPLPLLRYLTADRDVVPGAR
ncbi:MAG: PAS domain-containing protein [Gammaproteobacteria bacterium]|nr:PAS domain-containing protein [Gammaproteobacteria bacterium]